LNNIDVIQVRGLTKRFSKSTAAVAGLDLQIQEGTVYGFLGPNGAGKTTTLRMLAGLLRPTEGEASILGYSVSTQRLEVQSQIGFLPSEVRLYKDLTGEENLVFLGNLHPRSPSRRREMLDRFDIGSDIYKRKVSTYSRGTLQKLGIISAFQHDPPVYILDEPTTGLDPLMQGVLVELLEEEAQKGKTVLLSSHTISEVERACSDVSMIQAGRLIFEGSLTEAREKSLRHLDVVFAHAVEVDWHSLAEVVEVKGTQRHHQVYFRGKPNKLIEKLVGLPLEDLTISNPSLTEAFFTLYQERRN
jgi:ABC-2 type transport system ATP-binding protein